MSLPKLFEVSMYADGRKAAADQVLIAKSTNDIKRKNAHGIANCCGSLHVADIGDDETNWGVTMSVSEVPQNVTDMASAAVENVKVGVVYINLKLRTNYEN